MTHQDSADFHEDSDDYMDDASHLRAQRSASTDGAAGDRQTRVVASNRNPQQGFKTPPPSYRSADQEQRGSDYRNTDYRGIDPIPEANDAQINWASALWRYRFAVLLPAIFGLVLGGAYFTTLPNVYRSTARLIVKSERPWTPDRDSIEALRSIPSAEMLLLQLRSEHILDHAARHPLLAESAAQMEPTALRSLLANGVGFQNALQVSPGDLVVPFLLHFDNPDPQLAVNAVTALSDGLQNFFELQSETSISELKKLITNAKDKLLPELTTLEAEYQQFRENSELTWDKSGLMINPYREKQLTLQGQRLELENEQRDLATKLSAIASTMESSTDPTLVMEVVHQLLGKELVAARDLIDGDEKDANPMDTIGPDEDLLLAKLAIEKVLLPLEIERDQLLSEFGSGHPSVRQLEQQITATRDKLNELKTKENERLAELRLEGATPSEERLKQKQVQKQARAQLAVSGFMRALETSRTVIDSQIEQLDTQIESLSEKASDLARQESDNTAYLRRIARSQRLLENVEEQMSKINLSDLDASIHVSQLNAPSSPSLISPILSRYLSMGLVWGSLLGLGLVYLLESHSKTYRNSDEIARSLNLRILSHVPTDTRKLPKVGKGQVYQYHGIDPGLSAIHRPRSATSESVRRLRTAVFFDANAIGAKVIQVTSPLPEDGKSTLAANLAVSMAQSGKSVVIVDADMRRPQMTSSFGMENLRGLTDLIDGSCDPSQVIHKTAIANLSLVPCGPIPANPAEALSMNQFTDFLGWLRERYDYVIVDTPPLLIVTDPSIVASAVDGIVFTFRIRRGCRPQTKEAVAMLRSTGTPIFGCVISRVDHNTTSTGYQGYQASSYYGRRYSNYSADQKPTIGDDGQPREFVVSPKPPGVWNEELASAAIGKS